MLSLSAATISNKCQHIKHRAVLALILCTSQRCTWTGHIWCSLCTVTRSFCTCLHEAATDELGSPAYCIIILAEMDSAPCAFGQVRPTPFDRMTGMAVSRWNGTTAIQHWICGSVVTRMAGKRSLSNQNVLRHSSLTFQIQSERMASL